MAPLYLISTLCCLLKCIFSGLATWGKKVGRKWEQLKRSDSTEILETTPTRKSQVNHPSKPLIPPSSNQKSRKVSRVESLRHMFARGNSNAQTAVNKDPSTTNNTNGKKNNADWVKNECQKGIADLYQINSLLLKGKDKKTERRSKSSSQPIKFKKNLIETVMENPLEENGIDGLVKMQQPIEAEQMSEPGRKSLSHDDLLSKIQEKQKQKSFFSKSSSLSFDQLGQFNKNESSEVFDQNDLTRASKDSGSFLESRGSLNGGVGNNWMQQSLAQYSQKQDSRNVPLNLRTQPHLKEIYNFLNNIMSGKSEESGYESDSLKTGDKKKIESCLPERKDEKTGTSLNDTQNLEKNTPPIRNYVYQNGGLPKQKSGMTFDNITTLTRNKKGLITKEVGQTHLDKPKSKADQEFPTCGNCKNSTIPNLMPEFSRTISLEKEFKRICLSKHQTDELGLYVEKVESGPGRGCYIISHIEPGGLTDR